METDELLPERNADVASDISEDYSDGERESTVDDKMDIEEDLAVFLCLT